LSVLFFEAVAAWSGGFNWEASVNYDLCVSKCCDIANTSTTTQSSHSGVENSEARPTKGNAAARYFSSLGVANSNLETTSLLICTLSLEDGSKNGVVGGKIENVGQRSSRWEERNCQVNLQKGRLGGKNGGRYEGTKKELQPGEKGGNLKAVGTWEASKSRKLRGLAQVNNTQKEYASVVLAEVNW